MRRSIVGFVLSLCLGGCSGGGSSAVHPPIATEPGVGQLVPVTFSFQIGKASATSRSTSSIDPATLSVSVVVNGTPQYVNVTPPCAPCTATVNAPTGADTFTAMAFSGTGGTGVALDATTATVNQTVVTNTTNHVTLTLAPVVSIKADSGPGSLRNAVANAAPGDTITFLPAATPTITLASPIALTKNVTINGPGVASQKISGAFVTGIFTVSSAVNATIKNLTLANGYAPNGGVISNAGSLTLDTDTLTLSNATSLGGGVYSVGTALTITNSTFSSNGAANGGALYISGGTISVTATTFQNNSATNNGGAISDVNTSDTFDNDTFLSNNVGSFTQIGKGGAVYIAGGTISNSTFNNNAAVSSPGNTTSGGAVAASGALTLTNDNMSNNTASSSSSSGLGGAVYSTAPLTVTGGTYLSNQALAGGSTASARGGAIHATGVLTVTGATFTSNSTNASGIANTTGGAIYSTFGGSISGSIFTGNSAIAQAGVNAQGGALFSLSAFTITGCTFSGDSALTAGGGMYLSGGTTDTVLQSSFTNESITGTGSNLIQGGAIYNDSGNTIVIKQVTFSGNKLLGSTLADGAGVFNGGTATITNSTFFNNQSSYNAGGLSSGFGGATVNLSTFYGNSATFLGGNMLVQGSANITTFGSVYVNAGGPNNIGHNGTITSNGYNWADTLETGFTGLDHNLAPPPGLSSTLATNGSLLTPAIQTLAPNVASGLIGTIPLGACTAISTVDERGLARGHGNPTYCTIGAVEYP